MLIELLIVVVIIAIGVGLWAGFARSGASDVATNDPTGTLAPTNPTPGQPTSIPGRAVAMGRREKCLEQLRQIRASLQMAEIDGEKSAALPPDTASINTCPASNQPYVYDSSTGEVRCTTPGHEKN